jgi:hypothetical protein
VGSWRRSGVVGIEIERKDSIGDAVVVVEK